MAECTCELGTCDRHTMVLTGHALHQYRTNPHYAEKFDMMLGREPGDERLSVEERRAIMRRIIDAKRCVHRGLMPTMRSTCGCVIYSCDLHEECTINQNLKGILVCSDCSDRAMEGNRIKWQVIVTTSPVMRRENRNGTVIETVIGQRNTLPLCLRALLEAGWGRNEITVYGEPGSVVPDGFNVVVRERRLGCWPNLYQSVKDTLAKPCNAILCVEDDTVVAEGTRRWLEDNPWPPGAGMISLFRMQGKQFKARELASNKLWMREQGLADSQGWVDTDDLCHPQVVDGYMQVRHGEMPWGSCAFVLLRETAEALMQVDPATFSGTPDCFLGTWIHDHAAFWLCKPSRAQHLTQFPSSRTGSRLTEHMAANDYVAEVPTLPKPSVFHLLFYVWPLRSNDVWKRNVAQVLRRWHVFNGKKVVAIATGANSATAEEVKRCFAGRDVKFIEFANDGNLREGVAWYELLNEVQSIDPSEAFFYAHAKGVTHPTSKAVTDWRNGMYHHLLDDMPKIVELLDRHPCVGTYRQRNFDGTLHRMGQLAIELRNSQWHYSGTFFWVRSCDLFNKDWRKVPMSTHAVEFYLPHFFQHGEAACVYNDNPVGQYRQSPESHPDPDDWRRYIRPALTGGSPMKIGIDLDGTVLAHPEFFAEFIAAMAARGHKFYCTSARGRNEWEQISEELRTHNIDPDLIDPSLMHAERHGHLHIKGVAADHCDFVFDDDSRLKDFTSARVFVPLH